METQRKLQLLGSSKHFRAVCCCGLMLASLSVSLVLHKSSGSFIKTRPSADLHERQLHKMGNTPKTNKKLQGPCSQFPLFKKNDFVIKSAVVSRVLKPARVQFPARRRTASSSRALGTEFFRAKRSDKLVSKKRRRKCERRSRKDETRHRLFKISDEVRNVLLWKCSL